MYIVIRTLFTIRFHVLNNYTENLLEATVTYRKCYIRAKVFGNLSLPIDVDGHNSVQSLILDLIVIQEKGDTSGVNQNFQLMPASIKKPL